MGQMGYTISDEIYPRELGLNAVAVNVTRTSNAVGCEGYNQLTVSVDYTFGNGTALTMYAEETNDLSGTPVWRRIQSISIAAGVGTLSNLLWSKTVGAANQNYTINIPLTYKNVRIVFAMTGAPNAADLITVRALLGIV
jgi:hypothetical protein